jgi:branched-chain amino acid transport system ATP-binding protein
MLLPTDQPMEQITVRRYPFRRRAADALGRALMSEPQLLMLDEPSLGFAPAVVEALYDKLEELYRGGLTLLLAEQSIPLALAIADYAYVLQTGRVALEGTAADLEDNDQVREIYLGFGAGVVSPGRQE